MIFFSYLGEIKMHPFASGSSIVTLSRHPSGGAGTSGLGGGPGKCKHRSKIGVIFLFSEAEFPFFFNNCVCETTVWEFKK